MRLYVELGERGAALRCYRQLEETLRRDLDVVPEPATLALGRAVLQPSAETATSPTETATPSADAATPVARATPVRRALAAFRCRTPLVGRAAELARLGAALATVEHGARIVFIGGEPGIGKTRLMQEFGNTSLALGYTVLYGACHEEESSWPYAPVVHALARFCRRQDRDYLRVAFSGCAAISRLMPELAGDLPDLDPGPPLPTDQERRVLHHAIATFLAQVAGAGPVLLLLDDLQWAGETTLALIRDLLSEAEDLPLLLLATYRDGDVEAAHPLSATMLSLERAGSAERLTLGPLPPADVRQLVALLGGGTGPMPDDLLRRAGGNPFLTEGLLAGSDAAEGSPEASQPRTSEVVGASIRRRAALLPAPGLDVLQTAAAIGEQFPRGLVQRVAGLDDATVIAALDAALRAQLLRETGEGYGFQHALVRDVLYAAISRERRELLHGRIGETLDADAGSGPGHLDAIAFHYSRSPRHREQAIEALFRAGRESARIYANAEAVEDFRRALDLLAHLPAGAARDARGCAIGIALADVETLRGEHAAALAAAQAALAVARAPEERAGLLRRIGVLEAGRGEEGAWARFTAAEAMLAAQPRGVEWGRLRVAMARALIDRDDPAAALPLLREALALFQAVGGGTRAFGDLATAYNALGGSLIGADATADDTARALEYWREALQLWEAIGDEDGVARAYHNLGLGHRMRAEWEMALARLQQAESISHRTGHRRLQALAQANLGECFLALGRWSEARTTLAHAAEQAERAGQISTAAHACANAGWVSLALGAVADGERWLTLSLTLADRLGSISHRWFTLRGLGRLAEIRDLPSEAERYYRDACSASEGEEPRCRIASLLDLSRVARLRADHARARSHRAQARQALAGHTGDWVILLRAALALEDGLAHAEADDDGAATHLLAEAAALAEQVTLEPAEAQAIHMQATIALASCRLRLVLAGQEPPVEAVADVLAELQALRQLAEQRARRDVLLVAQHALSEARRAVSEHAQGSTLLRALPRSC
jgi:tetratricopeptide (TPR) repeat protein